MKNRYVFIMFFLAFSFFGVSTLVALKSPFKKSTWTDKENWDPADVEGRAKKKEKKGERERKKREEEHTKKEHEKKLYSALNDGAILHDKAKIKQALDAGANINTQFPHGTVLHAVIDDYPGNVEVVQFVLEHGANPLMKNSAGQTVVDLAGAIDTPDGKLIRAMLDEYIQAYESLHKVSVPKPF